MNENQDEDKKELGDYLFGFNRIISNFWYHYKFAILMFVGIAAILVFAVNQCAGKIEGDVNVLYAGSESLDMFAHDDLISYFNENIEDYNGDGKINAEFSQFLYMTDEQIENARALGKPIDTESIRVSKTQINIDLSDGGHIIYFLEPEIYKSLKKSEGKNNFDTIELLLENESFFDEEYKKNNLYDDCALKLSGLGVYELFAEYFPEDTVVAVRNLNGEKYERNLKLFMKMVKK